MNRQRGITLIEMSLVLVIIGLLVGSVMVANVLVHTAEIRSQVSEINQYTAAVATFRLKFNGIPGDLNNAVELGISANTCNRLNVAPFTQNGDGDGLVEAGSNDGTNLRYGGEMLNFWVHLTNGGLIGEAFTCTWITAGYYDAGTAYPKAEVGRSLFVASSHSSLHYILGGFGDSHNWEFAGAEFSLTGMQNELTAADALAIDSKLDDGSPNSGGVRPISQISKTGSWDGTLVYDTANTTTNCIYNSVYNTTYAGTYNDGYLCTLAIKHN